MERSQSFGSGSDLELEQTGEADTLDFRIRAVESSKKVISLWHDICLTHIDHHHLPITFSFVNHAQNAKNLNRSDIL